MKLKKLNARGFSHEIFLIAFVMVFAIGGVAYLVASHADSCASPVSGATSGPASGSCPTSGPVSGGQGYSASCAIAVPPVNGFGASIAPIITITNTSATQSIKPSMISFEASSNKQFSTSYFKNVSFPTIAPGAVVSRALNVYTVPSVETSDIEIFSHSDLNNDGTHVYFECSKSFKVSSLANNLSPLIGLANYTTGHHFYTTDPNEVIFAVNGANYRYDTFLGYLLKKPGFGAAPLYALTNTKTQDNFYTSDTNAVKFVEAGGYTYRNIIGYVSTVSSNPVFKLVQLNDLSRNTSTFNDHYYSTNDYLTYALVAKYGYKLDGKVGYIVSP